MDTRAKSHGYLFPVLQAPRFGRIRLEQRTTAGRAQKSVAKRIKDSVIGSGHEISETTFNCPWWQRSWNEPSLQENEGTSGVSLRSWRKGFVSKKVRGS